MTPSVIFKSQQSQGYHTPIPAFMQSAPSHGVMAQGSNYMAAMHENLLFTKTAGNAGAN